MKILSLSYGKDSMACLFACEKLGIKIDKIITVDIMFDKYIKGSLPDMEDFKGYADKQIKNRFGIDVIHLKSKITYKDQFYTKRKRGKNIGKIYGFPMIKGQWCNRVLKLQPINDFIKSEKKNGSVKQIIGIAYDERKRIERFKNNEEFILPLVDLKWTENKCIEVCEKNKLLSPVYYKGVRDGCWFCHFQRISNLRNLYDLNNELFNLLLELDKDSPVKFKPNASVFDFYMRFKEEDKQTNIFDFV